MDSDDNELPERVGLPDQVFDEAADDRLWRLREAAVRIDTQPGLLAVARRVRARLPGDERFGDPLSTAGLTPVEFVARGVSALRPERESVIQEVGLAGLQVWQALADSSGRSRGDQPLALLFTDLVGFSSWALKAGDAAVLQLLREVGAAEETAVLARRGQIVKRLGDGLMASFLTVPEAVTAALEAHRSLDGIDVDGYRPRMRSGVHYGLPRRLGGDLLGVDVNVAARVGDAAKPGELLVSNAALELLAGEGFRVGRTRRLRADGVPRDTYVARVSAA
jgi:adenylate cyclase